MSQIPSKNEMTKPKSALDVAVNQLVRASVGGVPSTVSDESLDKYVADLILKEAATKNKQYNKDGLRAYLPHTGTPPCNLPKTNKRFLLNVVRNVDVHNQALIRKIEEEAAARRRALNRSRRRHDSDDERRRHSRKSRHSDRYHRKDRKTSNTSDDYDRYYSDDDSYSDSERDRKLYRKEKKYSSRSSRSSKYDDVKSSSSRTRSTRRSVSSSSSSSLEYLDKTSTKLVSNELRKEQPNLSIDSPSNKSTSQLNIIKKGRGEVSNGSKMDKYFRKDYDPMFDIEPFIGDNDWFNYDGFNQMITGKSLDDDDTKKKKKKHKEKSKHKKEKHKSSNKSKKKRKRDSDSEISSDSEDDQKKHRKNDVIPISIREWDVPKLISGTWDPDKTI